MPTYNYGEGATTSLTREQLEVFRRLGRMSDSDQGGEYSKYAEDVAYMQANPELTKEFDSYVYRQPTHNQNWFSDLGKHVIGPGAALATLAGAGSFMAGAPLGSAGGSSGGVMSSLGNGGAYNSFLAPEALSSVPAATEIGGSGLLGGSTGGGVIASMGDGGALQSFVAPEALASVPEAASLTNGLTGGGILDTLKNGASAAGNFLKDNPGLTTIASGLLGTALNGDTTTTSSKDPWGPAQGYLKDNLATNANMQAHYQANPFSDQQKQAYQGLLDTNANGLSNAGNYNHIAQNFMGSNRGLMGQMPTLNTGVKAPQVDWSKYANIGKA